MTDPLYVLIVLQPIPTPSTVVTNTMMTVITSYGGTTQEPLSTETSTVQMSMSSAASSGIAYCHIMLIICCVGRTSSVNITGISLIITIISIFNNNYVGIMNQLHMH